MTPPPAAAALAAALHRREWPNEGPLYDVLVDGTCLRDADVILAALAASGWQVTREEGLRAALERLRVFVIEQGIRGGPPIEVVGRIAAEIDREQARAALASGEEEA